MELMVAFATDNEEKLKNDGHYGDAEFYLIYKIDAKNAEFLKKIENPKFTEKMHGDPNKAKGMARLLKDVDVLVGGQFGKNITRMIEKFVCVVPRVETISQAVDIVRNNFDKILYEKNNEDRKPLIIK